MNIFQDNQNDYQMQFMRNETKLKILGFLILKKHLC